MQLRSLRKAFANVLVAFEVVFSTPAVEAETPRIAAVLRSGDDRAGVAQPDVPERFDDNFGEGAKPPRGPSAVLRRGNQPALFAVPPRMDCLSEGRDFAFRGLEVAEPQLGIAR